MAILAYFLVIYLHLHACTARVLLMASDNKSVDDQFQASSKDFGTSDRNASDMVHLDNNKFFPLQEAENNEGKKTKSLYSWKVLNQATETEISNRSIRSMLESSPRSSTEERVKSKDNSTMEDVDVMDYAQPHRKPPIHNKGT